MATTPERIKEGCYRNLERETGTTIPGRLTRVRSQGLTRHPEIVAWLKP